MTGTQTAERVNVGEVGGSAASGPGATGITGANGSAGAPATTTYPVDGQGTCLEKLQRYLRSEAIPFQVQHHPAAYTAREVALSEHLAPALVAKVVVVFSDGGPAMLVLPADTRLTLPETAGAIGATMMRLAHETELLQLFPDCEPGTMPPFGNLYDVPVYVDRLLTEDERIVFQAGTHTDTISLRFADFARLVTPTVAHLAHPVGVLAGDGEA